MNNLGLLVKRNSALFVVTCIVGLMLIGFGIGLGYSETEEPIMGSNGVIQGYHVTSGYSDLAVAIVLIGTIILVAGVAAAFIFKRGRTTR